MTTLQEAGTVPEWSMGDRLRKARTMTGMSVDEFAARCLISAKSVNNYEGDRVAQRPLVVEKWAAVTGVSLEWLMNGVSSGPAPTPPSGPKKSTDALDKLTQAKRSKARRAGGTDTERYLPAAA